MIRNTTVRLLPLLLAVTLLPSCSVDRQKKGNTDKVEVQTPVGDLNVTSRKEAQPSDVGLAGYPGARPISDEGQGSAQAHIAMPFLNLKMAGVKFESSDPPQKILEFYRHELGRYGQVKEEHRGSSSTNIQGFSWRSTPDQVTLSAGPGDTTHVVAVQPEGSGSKFALLYIRAKDPDQQEIR